MNLDPCQLGGTCENTPGFFICTCLPGVTGHRCQFSDVCSSSPCPSNHTCVLTVTNTDGFVCEVFSDAAMTTLLTVMVDMNVMPSGVLDDQVNTIQETSVVYMSIYNT